MNPFKGRHFQRDIILWAVRWYCKYGISYRELQEMLAERGVNVDHSTIYRWVQGAADQRAQRRVGLHALRHVQLGFAEVADARREAEA
ncbi:hypothetical protein TUM17580_48300 [Citrobacter farmeri]|nr:hypothetical protein TUM17580_48300 [Citrobacter farmeri]